jgi:hypothetical protein
LATLHRVFKALEVAAFERVVGEWLTRTEVAPTGPLALDGKSLLGIHGDEVPGVHLVAAYAHEARAVVAQLRTEGKGQELAAAKEVLGQVPLEGRLVTGDALLTQREVSEKVVRGGGDYLLPVKDNQPSLRADLEAAFSPVAGYRTGRAHSPTLGSPGAGSPGWPHGWGDGGGIQGASWATGGPEAMGPV